MKLRDVCKIRYGKDHKRLETGNIPVYGSGGIMRYVDSALWSRPSVLIPRKGTLKNLFYTEVPFWTVDTLFWTEIDESVIVPKFLYYQLRCVDIASLNVGTAVPSLTTEILNALNIKVPALEVQRCVVAILDSLDKEIKLNERINDYLAA